MSHTWFTRICDITRRLDAQRYILQASVFYNKYVLRLYVPEQSELQIHQQLYNYQWRLFHIMQLKFAPIMQIEYE